MNRTSFLKLSLLMLALECGALPVLTAGLFTNLVGDMDQNPPPNPDGHGIIHESDDPDGFDMRQAGGTVTWVHDLSAALCDQGIATAILRIAVVGLIDGHYGIDNRLFVNGVEVLGAFDNSMDGWRLYVFQLDPSVIANGTLLVELRAHSAEGWGGPDYSELVVTTEQNNQTPAPRLTSVAIQAASPGESARFSGTVTGGPPLGRARLQASLDLDRADPWSEIATTTFDAAGCANFVNITDPRPQAAGALAFFFRVVVEPLSAP